MIYISSADCVGRNWGEIGGRITWIQGTMNTYRTAHELGHNFGLGHAHSKRCTGADGGAVALSGSCTSDEYGDRFNVMGYVPPGFGENNPSHLSAPQKDALGWLSGRSLSADQGTFTLAPTEDQSASLHALRFGTPGHTLWIEYRQPRGVDAPLGSFPGITGGVVIHETEPTTGSWLLDMTPGTSLGFNDAALPVGATWTDAMQTVSVRVNSAGPAGASVTLEVARCEQIRREIAGNEAEIRALQEELRNAAPGEKAAIVRMIRNLQAANRQLAAEARQLAC
jgi:hypothetical protein